VTSAFGGQRSIQLSYGCFTPRTVVKATQISNAEPCPVASPAGAAAGNDSLVGWRGNVDDDGRADFEIGLSLKDVWAA
jgi:hypothetical protein